MKNRISQWLRRKTRPATQAAGAYFTVLFDPDGRLMVCEDGIWKAFELDREGRVRAAALTRGHNPLTAR